MTQECTLVTDQSDIAPPALGRAKRLVRTAVDAPPVTPPRKDWGLALASPQDAHATMVCLPGLVLACRPGTLDWTAVLEHFGPVMILDFESQVGLFKSGDTRLITWWDDVLTSDDWRRMPSGSSRVRYLLGSVAESPGRPCPRLLGRYATNRSGARTGNSAAEIVSQGSNRAIGDAELPCHVVKPLCSETIDGERRIWLNAELVIRIAAFREGQLRESMFRALPHRLREQALNNPLLVSKRRRLSV